MTSDARLRFSIVVLAKDGKEKDALVAKAVSLIYLGKYQEALDLIKSKVGRGEGMEGRQASDRPQLKASYQRGRHKPFRSWSACHGGSLVHASAS